MSVYMAVVGGGGGGCVMAVERFLYESLIVYLKKN
jgi:hypothetical protein